MAFAAVIRAGFQSLWDEGEAEFRRGLPTDEATEAQLAVARRAVLSIGDLLVAIDAVTCDDDAPLFARAMAPAVLTYLLREDDLIPSTDGQRILGVLDDAYLVHRAVMALKAFVEKADLGEVEESLAVLRRLLPSEVPAQLDALVEGVFDQVGQQLRALSNQASA